MLEVWEGEGSDPWDLIKTVKLDWNSRKYINIKVKNIINTYENDVGHE